MPVAGDRLGYECDTAREVRDDQRSVAGCLVFPGPELTLARPGPARPQGAIDQGYRATGGLRRVLRRWPELRCRLFDQWRQERDAPGDGRLVHAEDICPYFLGDVIAHVPARDDKRFTEGKFPHSSGSFDPRFRHQFADHLLEFAELLSIK